MSNIDIENGYSLPIDLKKEVYSFREIKIIYGIYLFLLDHLLIWMPVFLIFFYAQTLWPLIPFAWLISIRSMRGLECLVHEASHYNVLPYKAGNDFVGNFLAAIPVFSTVEHYRNSHSRHHAAFGTDNDPDKPRHEKLNLFELDREHPIRFFVQVINRIPKYVPGWWKAIGTTWRITTISLFWHFVLVIIPVSILYDLQSALQYWGITFFIPFFMFLPVLRLIGEAAEHDYSGKLSVAAGTFSNTGIWHKIVIHPHCDGYHTLHHLYAFIPHYSLPEVDRIIRLKDGENWLRYLRERKSVFEDA